MKPIRILTMSLILLLTSCATQEPYEEGPIMNLEDCYATLPEEEFAATTTLDAVYLFTHAASCEGLSLVEGLIVTDEPGGEGRLETIAFPMPAARELVPSWNVLMDEDARLTIRVSVESETGWSAPFLMADWSLNYRASLSNQSDAVARVSIDTIVSQGEPFERVKFIVEFNGGEALLRNLSFTTKPVEPATFDLETITPVAHDIVVPQKAQLDVPDIGSSICSPTSLAMVLSYYNHDFDPATVAWKVRDLGAQIFGNWSFNASYAGGFDDLYSRVEYIDDFHVIQSYLDRDMPLILSIRTTSKDQLIGSLMSYSSGHLIVLRGLVEKDGVWYAIVNDPASHADADVYREYRLDQLLSVWRGYAYVVSTEPIE